MKRKRCTEEQIISILKDHEHYYELPNNLTPTDVYYGRGQAVLGRT